MKIKIIAVSLLALVIFGVSVSVASAENTNFNTRMHDSNNRVGIGSVYTQYGASPLPSPYPFYNIYGASPLPSP